MCLPKAPKLPDIEPVKLPEPIEPVKVEPIRKAPPPPAATATEFGSTARPRKSRGVSSLRIRRNTGSSSGNYSSLNLPN